MRNLLALLIATYLLSGFVSTQVGLPAVAQVPIRIMVAGALALPFLGGVVFFAPTLSFGSAVGDHTSSRIIWSIVAAMAGAFAQYGRRLHRSDVPLAAVADGVIVSAVLQALVMIGTIEVDLKGGDLFWLVVGGACYFISNRLSNSVFAVVSPTLAAVWMSTEPIIALALSALFLGVWPSVWQCMGGSLLLIAAFSQYGPFLCTWALPHDSPVAERRKPPYRGRDRLRNILPQTRHNTRLGELCGDR